MASSSSDSSASPNFDLLDSLVSLLNRGNPTAINLDDTNGDQLRDGMNADMLPSQVGQTQDDFLDFGAGIDNFGFAPEFLAEQIAESNLDPLNFDLNFGHLEFGLGSEPMSASHDPAMTNFMGLGGANFNLLTGTASFPDGGLNWNVPLHPPPAAGDVHPALIDEGAQSRNTLGGNASQQPMNIAGPVSPFPHQGSGQSDPARTPSQTTTVSSPNTGNSHELQDNMDTNASPEGAPRELSEEAETSARIGASSAAPKTRRSTRRKTSTTRAVVQALRQDGIRKTRKQATRDKASEARKTTRAEKSKGVPQEDAWQVVVLQNQEVGTPSDSGSGNLATLDSSPRDSTSVSTSEADSGISSTKRLPGRRKQVFQHVEPTRTEKERLEWLTPPEPPSWTLDQTSQEPPAKRNFLPPGPHSKKGWVLARLREPDSDRPQYGWAVGQVHDPPKQAYLILSGPHRTQIKVVREYDRIEYSPENIEKLKEGRQDKKQGGRPETVYDVVTVDPPELLRLSSVYAVLHASSMSIRLGID